MGDFCLNLRHAPIVQMQHSNWSIAYTYDQLVKIKLGKVYKVYREIAQHFKKCVKCCAKHNSCAKYNLEFERKKGKSAKQLWRYMAPTATMFTRIRFRTPKQMEA